jgi:Trypsin-co-occurring domain 1
MSDILLIGSGQRIGDMSMAAGERDVNIAWDKIREQLKDIGGELQGLFSGHTSGATLDSVAIELGVTASGQVGIIVAKATVEVGTKITLTFTRPK